MNLILLIPFLIIFILTRNVAGLCDPMTGRILDSDYKALADGSVCPSAQFCKASKPPTNPPTGKCEAKGKPGSTCTSNSGCDPGTSIEGNKFVCAKHIGDKEGKCGCLNDELDPDEKENLAAVQGFSWEMDSDGKGCYKSVQSRKPCNPHSDKCLNPELTCRPRDGKLGGHFCLFPFRSKEQDENCFHTSDCVIPYECIDHEKCGCPPGTKVDPAVARNCIPRYVGFQIQCDGDKDCIPDWSILCNPTTHVCDCKNSQNGSRNDYEYFPQINGQDRCYLTREFGYPCVHDAVLTERGAEHDCRRLNERNEETNLICRKGICTCEENHFLWDKQAKICKQKHAWWGEHCDTDSNKPPKTHILYQCDSKLFLTCDAEKSEHDDGSSGTYKCVCIPGASLLPNKKKACKMRALNRKRGESCDNELYLCDPGLFLKCVDGTCNCVDDKAILDEGGKRCVFTNVRKMISRGKEVRGCLSIILLLQGLIQLVGIEVNWVE